MKGSQTIDGEVVAEYPSSHIAALRFLSSYPWGRVAVVDHSKIVVEEVGRNTGRIFGFVDEGTSDEILPLAKFLYLFIALRAACFCTPCPDWRKRLLLESIEQLKVFPKEARVPIPIICPCIQNKEFEDLTQIFSENIDIVPNPILLEPGVIPDHHYALINSVNSEIALMLISGISNKEDIVSGLKATLTRSIKTEDLWAAAKLSQEGLCSFKEALAL